MNASGISSKNGYERLRSERLHKTRRGQSDCPALAVLWLKLNAYGELPYGAPSGAPPAGISVDGVWPPAGLPLLEPASASAFFRRVFTAFSAICEL